MFEGTVRRIAENVQREVFSYGGPEMQVYISNDFSIIQYVSNALAENPHMIPVLDMDPIAVTEFANEIANLIRRGGI